jgi:SOS-response transcriptional repressor LexA
MKELAINQRVVKVIEHYGYNSNSLTIALNYKGNTRVYNIMRSRSKPSCGFLEDFAKLLPQVNMNWIVTGNGRMLNRLQDNIPVLGEFTPTVMAPISSSASQLKDKDYTDKLSPASIQSITDCELIRPCDTDAMQPEINQGDFLAIKKTLINPFTNWGHIFLIDIAGELILRRMTVKDTTIVLTSSNSNYPPVNVLKNDIEGVWEVKGVLSRL